MPEYRSPGVYVEEVETGAMAIEGVGTSTVGFLGETERGSVTTEFVSSFAEYKRKFGGLAQYRRGEPLDGTTLAYAVQGFFSNGGSRCYVGRITNAEKTGDLGLAKYDPPMAVEASLDAVTFGEVVTDRTVTDTIELSHAGIENDPAIELSSVTVTGSGFGMYQAKLPEETSTPHELTAGDPLLVDVAYNPTGASGHAAELTVQHDGANDPLTVPLSGTGVRPENAAELGVTSSVLDYGWVATDSSVRERVLVENVGHEGAANVTIDSVGTSGANDGKFNIENAGDFSSTDLAVDGDPMAIEVSVDTSATGTFEAKLDIVIDGSPDEQIDLRAHVADPADTLGSDVVKLVFDERVATTSEEKTLILKNMGASGDPPVTIDKVEMTGAGVFSASLTRLTTGAERKAGETAAVTVTFAPTSGGSPSGQVKVTYTNSGGQTSMTVELEGDAVEEVGSYEVLTATPLEYGDVVVDEPATESAVVWNESSPGASEITIDDVSIIDDPDDEYSLPDDLEPATGPPYKTLGGEQQFEIPVTVTPEATGLVEAKIQIQYTEPSGTTTETYDLTATGIEAMVGFEAVGPGEWGNRVAVTVRNGARTNDTFDVIVRYWTDLEGEEGSDEDVVEAQDGPDVLETYTDLTTDESSSNYYETVIERGSNLVEVERLGADRPANGTRFLRVPPEDNDTPDEVGLSHYQGSAADPRGERTGLAGFEEVDPISIVTVPDENSISGLTQKIKNHCENMADRFAILQAPQGAEPGDLPPNSAISEYAALYYPHIKIIDPQSGMKKTVPPGGHVAGIYARSDNEHGVWKAPANETVRGAVELEFPVTKADQDRLNPKGVNAIRSFPDRGIRVWGARTTSVNPQWKYVNVRRLFLYLEESIDEGSQWAVFESNTEKLWARVRQSVRNFLTTVWRQGGLAGSSPDEAFYVKADRTTMTQADIDNGKLIVEIGVAPVKPAEFVIFRITQWTEGVEGGS